MIQPFATLHLDPQKKIRGNQGTSFLHASSLPVILKAGCPCTRGPASLKLFSTSPSFDPFSRLKAVQGQDGWHPWASAEARDFWGHRTVPGRENKTHPDRQSCPQVKGGACPLFFTHERLFCL